MSDLASLIGSSVNSSKGVVKIVASEGIIKARNSDPLGSLALGTDTHKLYIYTGGGWYVINTSPA
jgi:hypothetical protein